MSDKRFEITIVVNGQPFEVKVGLDEQNRGGRGRCAEGLGQFRTARRAVGSCGTNPANPSIPARRSVKRALLQAPNYS